MPHTTRFVSRVSTAAAAARLFVMHIMRGWNMYISVSLKEKEMDGTAWVLFYRSITSSNALLLYEQLLHADERRITNKHITNWQYTLTHDVDAHMRFEAMQYNE